MLAVPVVGASKRYKEKPSHEACYQRHQFADKDSAMVVVLATGARNEASHATTTRRATVQAGALVKTHALHPNPSPSSDHPIHHK